MTTVMFRHLFAHVSRVVGAVAVLFLALFATLGLLDSLGDSRDAGLLAVVRDTMLRLPEVMYLLMPATCAVGAAVALALMDAQGEVALLRIMGVSARRLVGWLAAAASLWVVLHAAIGELLLPGSAAVSRDLESRRSGTFVASGEDLWLRTPTGFTRMRLLGHDTATVQDVWLFTVGASGLERLVRAERAQWDQGGWMLRGVAEAVADTSGWRFATVPDREWAAAPPPDLLDSLTIEPRHLELARLIEVRAALAAIGQHTTAHEQAIWNRLVDPLLNIVLVVAGLLVTTNRTRRRTGHASGAGAIALLVMLFYHYATLVLRQAALDADWPAFAGAALPPLLLTAALAFAWWWRVRLQ